MKLFRKLCAIALAASAFSANAALTTFAPWEAAYNNPTNGLGGVLFNVQTNAGVTVALGAHAYKNGVFLPNDGVSTYQAQPGIFAETPALNRANWSFDFGWNLGTACAGCVVTLRADIDPGTGVNMVDLFSTSAVPGVVAESWNMEMGFINGLLGYDFNPFAPSSTAFELLVTGPQGGLPIVSTNITVNVPEPSSLALLGLALFGMAGLRRRKA